MHKRRQLLNEGLRSGDLENYVSNRFSIDRYKSKMGDDQDIVVVGFRVKEKYPAIDLMEFIEKGYEFILDADISSGEEQDGQYQVFVEISRTPQIGKQLKELLSDIGYLTKQKEWVFNYQKSPRSIEFNEENINEHVPKTIDEYKNKITEIKTGDLQQFFNQGSVAVSLGENNEITFKKPFAGDVTAKFVAIGEYDAVKNVVPGKIKIDEQSHGEVMFLIKYLGNYDIDKIENNYLIRNGDQAVVIKKEKW